MTPRPGSVEGFIEATSNSSFAAAGFESAVDWACPMEQSHAARTVTAIARLIVRSPFSGLWLYGRIASGLVSLLHVDELQMGRQEVTGAGTDPRRAKQLRRTGDRLRPW